MAGIYTITAHVHRDVILFFIDHMTDVTTRTLACFTHDLYRTILQYQYTATNM